MFLGAVFSGQMMTLFYSLGGGLLCWLVLLLLSRLLTWKQIWLCSPISAVFHNLGQLLVAAALLGSWTVLAYLPYLVVAGAASGLFTGLCAQLLAEGAGPQVAHQSDLPGMKKERTSLRRREVRFPSYSRLSSSRWWKSLLWPNTWVRG